VTFLGVYFFSFFRRNSSELPKRVALITERRVLSRSGYTWKSF